MDLRDFFRRHPKAALGFSGGVDSAYLLAAGLQLGAQVQPYFVKTPFQPAFELADAKRLCRELGAELTRVELDVLALSQVRQNGPDRCYHCKAALFTALRDQALADGYSLLIDGTNASDDAGDRPGMRALKELSVRSPLRECGITKEEVRRRSKDLGLFTWNKPAYACLATRVPTGEPITPQVLEKVEHAEDALVALGFSDLRVRVFHGAALLQLPAAQLARAAQEREAIRQALSPWFAAVLLDLNPR